MCGISGAFSFNQNAEKFEAFTKKAVEKLKQRGPDSHGIYTDKYISLGHTRLSVIDPSPAGNQPFFSEDGNTIVVFNGEFYNHKSFRKELMQEGYHFKSDSDTEVILQLYRKCGTNVVKFINGCFALAIWDKKKNELLIARDRMGIKPLYFFQNNDFFAFASEMKGLLEYPIPRKLDTCSMFMYFQLNYVPDHQCMIQDVRKLEPGHFITISSEGVHKTKYYSIPNPTKIDPVKLSYEEAKKELHNLLEASVDRRMISDVPLGAFLSGGIDSSIIVALAAKKTAHLNTFSIGFKDEPFFDETKYAEMLANQYQTNHTSFSLTNDELFEDLFNVLDYIDEPFADSSAIAVHILSQHTKKHVTVALSGDGADEIFGGYNKYIAHEKALHKNFSNQSIKLTKPLWDAMPKSRNSGLSNTIRQIARYSEGLNLSPEERYWRWCSLSNESQISRMLTSGYDEKTYFLRKEDLTYHIRKNPNFMHAVLYADMKMVLCQDMLMKVDLMSMANGLEVRTPFLDHHVVDFAFKLPFDFKIHEGNKKRILKDSFSNEIPQALLNRKKHGFEVPLLNWFRKDLSGLLDKEIFNPEFIKHQALFDTEEIMKIKTQLRSKNPGDIHARIWALLVFQTWYKKYF
jgi:asparagine synthase (glutamine-hydrolysing)